MSKIDYLNTDLIIESPDDLTPIAEDLGEDVVVMYNGKWGKVNRAAFEIAGVHSDANETIQYFCSLVEGLGEREQAIWDSCFSKVFDIGYESGTSAQNFSSVIRPGTVKRIAGIGAAIEITIYPPIDKRKKH
ncbi:MAG: hypothetical protein SRB2_03512 [Desulfobacteraceae bacterium Eth-SRB2]|nr:MAG: hypothetical protein SRB2_03512 [Desulfobacteraceae bacterium Eth-SRB2]